MLLRNGIALWDAAVRCDISASSDSSMRNIVPSDLSDIFSLCEIDRVLCNGAAAYAIYMKNQRKQTELDAVLLPSTSPANARYSLALLTEAWKPHIIR